MVPTDRGFLQSLSIPSFTKMFTRRRNRPRRSKSRWFKELEKKMPYAKIVEAYPKAVFMTVIWRPRNEEEKKMIEEHNKRLWMSLCIGVAPAFFLNKMGNA
jgi:hypothetical protein